MIAGYHPGYRELVAMMPREHTFRSHELAALAGIGVKTASTALGVAYARRLVERRIDPQPLNGRSGWIWIRSERSRRHDL